MNLLFLDPEVFLLNFRLIAEEKERKAMAPPKPVKVEEKKHPKPVKKPGENT